MGNMEAISRQYRQRAGLDDVVDVAEPEPVAVEPEPEPVAVEPEPEPEAETE